MTALAYHSCQVTTREDANEILLDAQYQSSNSSIYRSVGGRYSGTSGWIFPDTVAVRKMIAERFGVSDQIVDALVPAYAKAKIDDSRAWCGGYVLARASRDGRYVHVPCGVSIASGNVSVTQYHELSVAHDTVFRLQCRKDFAVANNLEIIGSGIQLEPEPVKAQVVPDTDSVAVPLSMYSNRELIAEIERRKIVLVPEGEEI